MSRKPVKTHTFKMGTVEVWQGTREGWVDDLNRMDVLEMGIPDGNSFKTLAVTVHEAMHAELIPDRYLDGERDAAEHIARFLWRLGYRKQEDCDE